MNILIHISFIIGIIIAIIGWFFNHASSFNWLILMIASNYIFAKRALGDLEKDQKIALTKHHEGFKILLDKWPNLHNKDSVEYIGRSVAFVSFGAQAKNDIQIIAYDTNKNEIKERWSILGARSELEKIAENKLFKIGAIFFWSGISISIASHIISSLISL